MICPRTAMRATAPLGRRPGEVDVAPVAVDEIVIPARRAQSATIRVVDSGPSEPARSRSPPGPVVAAMAELEDHPEPLGACTRLESRRRGADHLVHRG